jgi:hypothetical protein
MTKARSPNELEEWDTAIQGRPIGFLCCVTYPVGAGTKP